MHQSRFQTNGVQVGAPELACLVQVPKNRGIGGQKPRINRKRSIFFVFLLMYRRSDLFLVLFLYEGLR